MDRRATMAKINSRAADQQRHERWRELLARWQSSGLSQAAFCRRERIHVWQFAWWKKRGATCSDVATMCAERLRFRCSGSGCDCQATCLSVTMGRWLRLCGDGASVSVTATRAVGIELSTFSADMHFAR